MAKSKTVGKKKNTQQQRRRTGPKPRRQPMYNGLDQGAIDHIKLMSDPCQGKLVHPAYESPGGGAVIRYRRFINIGAQGSEKNGAFSWSPGTNEYVSNGADSASTGFTPSRASMFPALVSTGGDATNSAFRCVAACVKFITNASELNRSGLIYAGNTDLNQYFIGSNVSLMDVNNVASLLPITTRCPNKQLELVWTPGLNDTGFASDASNVAFSTGSVQSRNALTVAFTGAPTGVGYTIEVTGVYEVRFGTTGGIVSNEMPPASGVSWNRVLQGFSSFIRNSPVMIDGLRRATDYVAAAGSSYIGQVGARAAVGLLM